jgi:hypothetical protein
LGHRGAIILEMTAKIHDFKLNGEFTTCEQCAIAKVRQKSVKKYWKVGNQASGWQLYLVISFIKDLIYGVIKLWALIVDDFTD